jgi:hypothetical protein
VSIDERIRHLAREEAGRLLEGGRTPAGGAPDTAGLQQQITDLHEHLHMAATAVSRLEQRIDALEKGVGQTDREEQPPARRTARKTAGQ